MPKICYVTKKFSSDRMWKIDKANEIIEDYRKQGYELTLRQLYYQFVSLDLISNNQKEYKNLGDILNDARLAGLVDWEAIVDRTRHLRTLSHWSTPGDIISSAAKSYRLDKWATQAFRPEVWIEKDALVGVIEPVCDRNDVPYFSCRGYTSQSELWGAGMRLAGYKKDYDQKPIIFHLGDHDPSGVDMTRDIRARLELFAGTPVEVRRLALNMDQVKKYNPPPNPTKLTDSRCVGYNAEHGDECWELDALKPTVIGALIQGEIDKICNAKKWNVVIKREELEREQLTKVSDNWDEIVANNL